MSCTRPHLAQCKPFLPSWAQVTASTFKINLFREINNPSLFIRWFSAVLDLATCCLSHVKQGPQTHQSKVMFCPQVHSACVPDNTDVKRIKSMGSFISTLGLPQQAAPHVQHAMSPSAPLPISPTATHPPKKRNPRKTSRICTQTWRGPRFLTIPAPAPLQETGDIIKSLCECRVQPHLDFYREQVSCQEKKRQKKGLFNDKKHGD